MSEVLATTFSNAGHQVHLVTWTTDKHNGKLPFHVIRNPNLFRLLKEHSWADLVFENNPSLRLSWPVILFRKRLIVVLHTWLHRVDGSRGWQDRIKTIWLSKASVVIAASEALRINCWSKATVIKNPYNADKFKYLNHKKRVKDFVFLGRLVSDKGPDHAIRAIHRLVRLGVKTHLTIIGSGPESFHLKQLVEEFQLQESVEFTGALKGDTLVNTLNDHRFIIIPSIWEEPFGLVALEGMACGCLPIASNGGGLPEAIGNAGVVFQRGNLDSLVSNMKRVLSDPDLEQNIRENAAEHLKNHHPEILLKKYLNVVEKVLRS